MSSRDDKLTCGSHEKPPIIVTKCPFVGRNFPFWARKNCPYYRVIHPFLALVIPGLAEASKEALILTEKTQFQACRFPSISGSEPVAEAAGIARLFWSWTVPSPCYRCIDNSKPNEYYSASLGDGDLSFVLGFSQSEASDFAGRRKVLDHP